jgi:hypothetical protein
MKETRDLFNEKYKPLKTETKEDIRRWKDQWIPRWRLEGGSRKRASYSEILERHWRHTLQAKITEKRHNFDPSTPPAVTENLHFTLNEETRRAPGPPVTGPHTAWEDADQVSFAVPRYSHRQPWARAA